MKSPVSDSRPFTIHSRLVLPAIALALGFIAVPVAAADSLAVLAEEVDEVVCLAAPQNFVAVGRFYDNFDQTTDEEVIELLDEAAATRTGR